MKWNTRLYDALPANRSLHAFFICLAAAQHSHEYWQANSIFTINYSLSATTSPISYSASMSQLYDYSKDRSKNSSQNPNHNPTILYIFPEPITRTHELRFKSIDELKYTTLQYGSNGSIVISGASPDGTHKSRKLTVVHYSSITDSYRMSK